MRIAILGPYPIDGEINNIYGGVQAVVVNMIKGLSRFQGLEIHVIAASGSIKKNKDFILKGIHIHGIPIDRKFGNITFYARTRKMICKKITGVNPDLIHSHMFGYYTLAGLDSGHKNIVVSTHGLSNAAWNKKAGFLEKIRYDLQDRIYMKCFRGSDKIIVNSPYTVESLSGVKKFKIYELNNPVSDIFFTSNNAPEEEKRILFVGNICQAKGIMVILESLNVLRNTVEGISVKLAGPIVDKNFYIKTVNYIKENGLGEYVTFLGSLNDYELKKEYEKASIFAFPSYQDVAPVALLQAMAAGKAIVASSIGGIPYIIDDSVNGFLIKPGDADSLAEKIILFIKDAGLRRELGANAHKKVSENNRIDIVTDNLYRIYQEVAGIC
ncbi:MAG: glycosyltransferase family 4 protein [Candidatus Omnitrophota bacterium]